VHYIHIPKHAMQDFRTFARNVAAQACRDVATKNPYVQALNRHRAELESSLLDDASPGGAGGSASKGKPDAFTLEQRLSTKREALSTLSPVSMGVVAGEGGCGCGSMCHGSCGGSSEAPRSKVACGLQCCADRGGDLGSPRVVTSLEEGQGMGPREAVVYPLPALAASDCPTSRDVAGQHIPAFVSADSPVPQLGTPSSQCSPSSSPACSGRDGGPGEGCGSQGALGARLASPHACVAMPQGVALAQGPGEVIGCSAGDVAAGPPVYDVRV